MILLIQNSPLFCQFSHSRGIDTQSPVKRDLSTQKFSALRQILAVGYIVLFAIPQPSEAALYKCQIGGKTVYQDKECPGIKDSKPYTPRNPISTMSSEAMTGQSKKQVDKHPAWLKPIDPMGDCKARGGTIDKELRACQLP
jgi:hypothetical protein